MSLLLSLLSWSAEGFYEGRVVIELRVHVLFEFGERHLEHVYLQHLLLRQTLHLLQLLFLGLY